MFLILSPLTSQAKVLDFVIDNSHEINSKDKTEMTKIMKAHAKNGQYLFFATENQMTKEEYAIYFYKKYNVSKEIQSHSFLFVIFKKEHRIQGEPGQKMPKRFISGKALAEVFNETKELNLTSKSAPPKSTQALNWVKSYFKVLGSEK